MPSQASVVHGLPSSVHAVPVTCLASAGQSGPLPGQVSATSHSPAAARQSVPALPGSWIDTIGRSTEWNERKLEESLYGSNERAWKFWFQAKLAQARPGTDALEGFYLCVMLGFRGEGPERPDTVATWRDAVEGQLSRIYNQPWPGPQELQPEMSALPRRAKDRLRTLLIAVIGVVALLIPAATFYLVFKFK